MVVSSWNALSGKAPWSWPLPAVLAKPMTHWAESGRRYWTPETGIPVTGVTHDRWGGKSSRNGAENQIRLQVWSKAERCNHCINAVLLNKEGRTAPTEDVGREFGTDDAIDHSRKRKERPAPTNFYQIGDLSFRLCNRPDQVTKDRRSLFRYDSMKHSHCSNLYKTLGGKDQKRYVNIFYPPYAAACVRHAHAGMRLRPIHPL